MNRITSILSLSLMAFFSGCKDETVALKLDYNQKANEVIRQVIADESCSCILEMLNESMIELKLADNPRQDVRSTVIETLKLRDRKELDSVENLTTSFILDPSILKQQNVKMINRDSLQNLATEMSLLKKCPDGILSIAKPIFDKDYKIAAVDYGYTFICIPSPVKVYYFKNGKWIKCKTAGNTR